MNNFNGICSPTSFTAAAVFIAVMLAVAIYAALLSARTLRAEYKKEQLAKTADPFAITKEQRAREAFGMKGL